jgi:hypothetical protein
MATIIQIKRGTGTAAPGSLVAGELAATLGTGTQANAGDRLFVGDGTNVDVVGGKYFTDMLDQAHGTLTHSSTVIVDTNKRIDELIVGNHATNGGSIQFREGTGAGDHYMALKAPNSVTANITLTLPDGAGTNGQYLQTNGSDTLAWDTVVSSFTVAGDSGSDVVNTGETLTFTGGTGITTSAATNAVTFAIDNTVATLAGTQTFTNKTLTSPVLTTPQINDTSVNHQYVFAVSELTADRNVTLPLLAGNDEFTFNAHAQTLSAKSIDLGTNTLTGSVAEFNAALQSESFATLTGTETLTNKTLTTPTIGTSFTIGSATITEAELEVIDGATLTTDELNIMDGDTSVGTTAFAAGDGLVTNDGGTMQQTSVATLDTYLSASSKTLTNKSIDLGDNTLTGSVAEFNSALQSESFATLAGTETLTSKTLTSPIVSGLYLSDSSVVFEGTANDFETTLTVTDPTADRIWTIPDAASDTFVGKATTDTLTNKSIDLGDNTLTGSVAEFNAALQSENFATLTGTETLTNKTLTSPTLNTPTIGTSFTIGNATITETELEVIDGALLTTAELNIIDGDTSATSTTVADADRVVMNDAGTMVQVAVTDLAAYFDDEITAMPNLTSVGTLTALAVDNVSVNGNTISTTDTDGILVLSPNGSGTINASSSKIINVTDPTAAQDAATKAYVDATSNGLDVKASVDVATTADLDYTYNNGTLGVNATLTNGDNGAITLDGIALTADMRVLVKDQAAADADQNGIYYVSVAGASGVQLVLKRATDADTAAKLTGGAFTFVEQGSTQQDNGYVFTHNGTPTIGTTNLPVSQFSGAGQITAGTGLTKSGNTINAIGSATIIANAHTLEVNSSATQYQVLVSGGAALTAATFGQLSLNQSAAVTGTLPVANGGLGFAAFTAGDMMYATGTTTVAKLAKGTADQILMSNGSVPSWTSTLDGGTF